MNASSRGGRAPLRNAAAAEHLLNGYRSRLISVARRHSRTAEDAEDALARTVELTFRSCPITDDPAQVEAWARVVCTREAWKIVRRYRRKPVVSVEALRESGNGAVREVPLCDRNDALPDEWAIDAEARRELLGAIAELPEGQRAPVRAYALGFKTQEIADGLDRSHRSVRKALWRGKRTLRARLAESGSGP